MSQPRFTLPDAADLTPRQREVAEKIAGGPRGGLRGPYVALIHHPDLADVVQQLGEQLRFKSTLPPELFEFAILIIARHWTSQYEWVVHEKVARGKTTLPDALIRAVRVGAIPEDMTHEQRVVHDFVVRTMKVGSPANSVYDEAVELFGRMGVLDLITTCGYYCLIAILLNTAEIPLPDGVEPPLRALS
jgi:4-carboxymuconolactone decarboxylase